jgi:hypothetical protein
MLSSVLLMLEVQTRWWKPALRDIGWHGGHSFPAASECSLFLPIQPNSRILEPRRSGGIHALRRVRVLVRRTMGTTERDQYVLG